jgi:hypothetical protein
MDTPTNFFAAAQAINNELRNDLGPPEEGLIATKGGIVPAAIVRGTRTYIEKVTNQANGAYQNGWYDACAVMLRRLLETLIIETFEAHSIGHKIKNPQGDFFYLRDLIDKTVAETTWNLGRNTKSALPRLKDLGDKSAHTRRYIAVRDDLEKVQSDVRLVVQELLSIAGLK